MVSRIDPLPFYEQYNGHPTKDLENLVAGLRDQRRRILWLAGDSSLDNKHWLFEGRTKTNPKHLQQLSLPAIGGYEQIFQPAMMLPDVAFCINRALQQDGILDMSCVNTAVEASTLAQRRRGLTQQDCIIRDQLQPDDVLVVSLGGNDVALRPSRETLSHVGSLLRGSASGAKYEAAVQHFIGIFKRDIEAYINELVGETKPSIVAVCMIYFPSEDQASSWCGASLERMGYNDQPHLLQNAIQQLFSMATKAVQIPGVDTVVPIPLFEALDGKTPSHYHHRVEPSIEGGRKMASIISQYLRSSAGQQHYEAQERLDARLEVGQQIKPSSYGGLGTVHRWRPSPLAFFAKRNPQGTTTRSYR